MQLLLYKWKKVKKQNLCLLFIFPVWLWPNLLISMLPHSCTRDVFKSNEPTWKRSILDCIHCTTLETKYMTLSIQKGLELHMRFHTVLYKNKMKKWLIIIVNKAQKTNELTHWCVKSNMFLVRVEILVLLSTEFTNIAPSFWKQENT